MPRQSSKTGSCDLRQSGAKDDTVSVSDPLSLSPTAPPVFFRTYSRLKDNGNRESYQDTLDRCQTGLAKLGKFTPDQKLLTYRMQRDLKSLPSGRWYWVGGTNWINKPENYAGAYNCTSQVIETLWDIVSLKDLSMCGSGVGWVIENVKHLPNIKRKINLTVQGEFGTTESTEYSQLGLEVLDIRVDQAIDFALEDGHTTLYVGDSRQAWCMATYVVLRLFTDRSIYPELNLTIDFSHVRKPDSLIKGFGGKANPHDLVKFYQDIVNRLNTIFETATAGQFTPVDVAWLACRQLQTVVAGNIRRSAGMSQGASNDEAFKTAKLNLWQEDSEGNWKIDPERDALRMANFTTVYHYKPSLEEVTEAVKTQYYSSEGAIQFAPEAIARSNVDIFPTEEDRIKFIDAYCDNPTFGRGYLVHAFYETYGDFPTAYETEHRMTRYGLNPCFVPGTMVLTRKGHFPIETLVGQTVEIWDGINWVSVDNFRVTGQNQPVYNVTLQSGQVVTATGYHTFILTDGTKKKLHELQEGDKLLSHSLQIHGIHHENGAYLKGFMLGDGTTRNGLPALDLYEPKYKCFNRLAESANELEEKRVLVGSCKTTFGLIPKSNSSSFTGISTIPELIPYVQNIRKEFDYSILNWDLPSKLEFIAGYMDADGTALDGSKGFSYQVTSIHKPFLTGFQLLLESVGVKSSLRLSKSGGVKDFGNRGGLCDIQPLYRLTISQFDSIKLSQQVIFSRLKSFADRTTAYKLKDRSNTIISIEFSHIADKVYCCTVPTNNQFSLSNSLITGNCGEIIGRDFYCNLSEIHLNQLDPIRMSDQIDAFKAGALTVGALLHHEFVDEKFRKSREVDPIVGVSFTGLFDFFVNAFGVDWLYWWKAGRPNEWYIPVESFKNNIGPIVEMFGLEDDPVLAPDLDYLEGLLYKKLEQTYLSFWKQIVDIQLTEYCNQHGLRKPNRFTTVQPAGTKSLLTGASPGWHPPKAARYIRRITFQKNHPVALAAIDYGYSILPAQSDKDENGNLLNDPFDPRCTEWLVEIPVEMPWASLPGADQIAIEQFSAVTQFDFYMQVQNYYTGHNTSATIELREDEISDLSVAIYKAIENNEGYISAALQARFDAPFPRLPFEKIDKETYDRLHQEVLNRRKDGTFYNHLMKHDTGWTSDEGPSACDGDKCLLPLAKPE
jgi:ribonucleotide reductase, class II